MRASSLTGREEDSLLNFVGKQPDLRMREYIFCLGHEEGGGSAGSAFKIKSAFVSSRVVFSRVVSYASREIGF